MKHTKPNGPAVKLKGERTVELKECSCCKEDYRYKRRYFVRDKSGKILRMTSSWEGAQRP